MAKEILVISTTKELVNKLAAARCGGQYASIYYRNAVKVNKYPNGTPRKEMRPEIAFNLVNPTKESMVEYHFGQDYEKAMAKALGIDSYESDGDGNREHLVPSILMRYISTQNVCAIAIPSMVKRLGTFVDGNPATAEQLAYIDLYKQPHKSGTIPYMTIGLKNIYKMKVGNVEYQVHITDTTYTPDEEETPAYAIAQ